VKIEYDKGKLELKTLKGGTMCTKGIPSRVSIKTLDAPSVDTEVDT